MVSPLIVETLNQLDYKVFILLNSLYSEYWDNFFWIITSKEVWIPLYFSIVYVVIAKQRRYGIITILFIFLVILLCDQISTNICKSTFERFRPSHTPELKNIIHLVSEYTGGKYGFISSHAANTFGLAIFTSLLFKNINYSVAIFVWASINSYSRVYLGVHFPGDIFGGIIVGSLIGIVVYRLYLALECKYKLVSCSIQIKRNEKSFWFLNNIKVISYTLLLTLCVILLVAKVILGLH